MVTTAPLDVTRIVLTADLATGTEQGDADAIDAIHRAARTYAITPTATCWLLVCALIDYAELADNAPDVLTAVIAMLREWRDGGPSDGTSDDLDLHMLPVADLTIDEVISRADEPTEPSTVGRRR